MPWKIVKADYNTLDPTTLHDDELIAAEAALRKEAATPANETNPAWRAWKKIRPLAEQCDGSGDPVALLPPGSRSSPRWEDHQDKSPPVSGL